MSSKRVAVRTPRELQLERFLRAIQETGDQQLIDEFLTAFAEIAPPVHPVNHAVTRLVNAVGNNVSRESHVLRGFWVPVERTYVGIEEL
jgi:hypothetical protein